MLALGLGLTFGARMAAVMVAVRMERDEASINSNSQSVSTPPQQPSGPETFLEQKSEPTDLVIVAQPTLASDIPLNGEEELASKQADELIAPDPVRWRTSPSSQRPLPLNRGEWFMWGVVGVFVLGGFGLLVFSSALNGTSKNIQSTSSSQPHETLMAQSRGPFDGRWSATVGPQGACNFNSILVLDVVGSSIVGNATNPLGVFPLTGTVDHSGRGLFQIGRFVGTIRFSRTTFEANYANDCGGRFAIGSKRTVGNLN